MPNALVPLIIAVTQSISVQLHLDAVSILSALMHGHVANRILYL
jgi:hypothetical protein